MHTYKHIYRLQKSALGLHSGHHFTEKIQKRLSIHTYIHTYTHSLLSTLLQRSIYSSHKN